MLKTIRDKAKRKQWMRYWVFDPLFGISGFFIHYFLRWIPMHWNSAIGAWLGPLAFKTYLKPKAERARRNVKILYPNLTASDIDDLLQKMWINIGQTMCEYSILDKLWAKGRVVVDDSAIATYLTTNKPLIFTGVHLGNWEAQASYIHAKQIPLMAMYKPVRNRFMRKISAIARARMNIITVPTDAQAMKKMYEHLAAGGAVWLPIDDFKNNQVHTPRFGRPIATKGTNAAHIVRLAQRFHAAIIPVHIIRQANPKPSFKVIAYKPIIISANHNITKILDSLDQLMESWIRERPEQWFMLHELRL
jgi:KDO2-lipid IV(A) lauroyltransferase